MQCLTDIGSSTYALANPQPTEYTTCVHILATPTELTINAHALTVSQGSQIAVSIGILWAIAYVFRVCITLLKSNDGETKNE